MAQSISTNAFDLMRFPKARYASDSNGKPVVVIPVDDTEFYHIGTKNGAVSVSIPVVCQSKFNQPTSDTAPTHDFRLNLSKEQMDARKAQMLQYLVEHPEKMDTLVSTYTDLRKQPDGNYCYVAKDGKVGTPKTMEQIAALITYERITFAPGWQIKAKAPVPTEQASYQAPAAQTDDDLPF